MILNLQAYLGFDFLKQRVVEPQKYVTPPITFLTTRRNLSNGSFVHLSHSSVRLFFLLGSGTFVPKIPERTFLQSRVIEPDIVIPAVVCKLLFVLDASFAKNRGLQTRSRAVLFLEFCVRRVEAV